MTAPPVTASAQRATSVVIAPNGGRIRLDLKQLWAYRELAYFFVWRDIKVRYRQSVFGILWAIIQPVALMGVFALFLGRLNGISPANVSYPVFALVGLVPWTLVSKSLIAASESLVGASSLIQKVYFPRLIVPIAAIGAQLLDFVIALIVLLVVLLFSGAAITPAWLFIVPLTLLGLMLALGVGIWLSAANVRFRDVRHVVPLAVQVWLFASPIAYASSIVPDSWRWLYEVNPLVTIIEGYRWALLGEPAAPPLLGFAVAFLVSLVVLVTGLAYFRLVERTFADVI